MLQRVLPVYSLEVIQCLFRCPVWQKLSNPSTRHWHHLSRIPLSSSRQCLPVSFCEENALNSSPIYIHFKPVTLRATQSAAKSSSSRKNYIFPEIKEEDLEEQFVRGSGPGGSKVNTTDSKVVLKHLPTGIVVQNHETRLLEKNREKARQILRERLDVLINGDNSFLRQRQQEETAAKANKKKRSKLNLKIKLAFKEREGLD